MGTPNKIQGPVANNVAETQLIAGNSQAAPAPMPQSATPTPTPLPAPAQPSMQEIYDQNMKPPSMEEIYQQNFGASPEEETQAQQNDPSSILGVSTTNIPFMGAGNQFEELPLRAKTSFAQTDWERRKVLEQAFGEGNVKKAKDGFLVKRDKKWTHFDRPGFELLADAADFSREAVESSVAAGVTGAGLAAAAGETAGIATAPLAIPTVLGAGAAGGVAGKFVADEAAKAFGVPQDPSRSATGEYLMAAGGGALGAGVGQGVANYFEKRAVAKAAEMVASGPIKANQAAVGLGQFEQDIQTLSKAGYDATKQYDKVTQNAVAQHLDEASATVGKAIDDTADAFSNFSQVKQRGMEGIGKRFVDTFKSKSDSILSSSGKLIEKYRDQAIDAAGDGEIPVKTIVSKLGDISNKFGFAIGEKLPGVDQLVEKGMSEDGAKELINQLKGVGKLAADLSNSNGRMQMGTLAKLKETWTSSDGIVSNVLANRNLSYKDKNLFLQLGKAIDEDLTNSIGTVLTGDDKTKYLSEMARYSQAKGLQKKLASIVGSGAPGDAGTEAVVGAIFKPGAKALDRIRSTKALLSTENTELWKDITGAWLVKAAGEGEEMNFGNVLKTMSKLGTEELNEIAPKETQALLKAGLRSADKLSSASEKITLQPQETSNIIGSIASLAHPKTAIIKFLSRMDPQQKILESIDKHGIDAIIKRIPPKQRMDAMEFATKYLDAAHMAGAASAAGKQ